ncbi:MAG: glycosyltransferase [Okeania sp. SIO1H5]|nr:glycosyltransferase [Okeania sp. SIO1H5]
MDDDRISDAIPVLEKGVERYPSVLELSYDLGTCYLKVNQSQKARAVWEKAAALGSQSLPVLGEALEKLRRQDSLSEDHKKEISLCMIVKDEERNLADCLSSVQPFVDEMIIVDTGSEDDTIRIAAEFGARVYQIPWEKDFSRARNASIEKAKGSWILWLDADDRLPASSGEHIRQWVQTDGNESRALGLLVKNSNDGGHTGSVFNQIRLFPNHPTLRFRYPIHEQILPALEEAGIEAYYSDYQLIHTGYANEEAMREKQIRNRELLQHQIETNAHPTPVTYYTLANACFDLGDFTQAIVRYQEAFSLAQERNNNEHIASIVPTKVALCLAQLGRYQEGLDLLRIYFDSSTSVQREKVHPETYLVQAQILEALGNNHSARTSYEQLIDQTEEQTFIPVDTQLLKIKALQFLGHYWNHSGEERLGVDLLHAGLQIKNGVDFNQKDLNRLYGQYLGGSY